MTALRFRSTADFELGFCCADSCLDLGDPSDDAGGVSTSATIGIFVEAHKFVRSSFAIGGIISQPKSLEVDGEWPPMLRGVLYPFF